MNQLKNDTNYKRTENGALAHRTTNSAVYDMFAMGAAYRSRSDEDVILLFKNAFEENEVLALKCLFYIRDCRGGQGERRFFRVCMKWLAQNHPERIEHLLEYLPEYGRYDDLFELFDTQLETKVMALIRKQLMEDMSSQKNGISLIAKWLPSENASSVRTIARAKKIRDALDMTSKEYRKMLSKLREKINVLERLMSANEWDKIEFDKIPSRAGLIYKNAFARRDIIAKKYEAFAKDKNTTVNASTLYPYEVVAKALAGCSTWFRNYNNLSDTDRAMVNKYWENLPDYLNGADCSMMCVVDTSGSMCRVDAAAPINVAISLGLYCAERMSGPFAGHYISFASRPQLIKTEGIDFVDKVQRIYRTNLIDNTNLTAVFDLLLNTALKRGVKESDIPQTIVVISDMEIDQGTRIWRNFSSNGWTTDSAATEMEKIRQKWATYGLKLPKLVYWNVDARHNTILDSGPNVSFVSGMSPTVFRQVLTGKTGWDLMLETITAPRYESIK
jgi:hypothetical protein